MSVCYCLLSNKCLGWRSHSNNNCFLETMHKLCLTKVFLIIAIMLFNVSIAAKGYLPMSTGAGGDLLGMSVIFFNPCRKGRFLSAGSIVCTTQDHALLKTP